MAFYRETVDPAVYYLSVIPELTDMLPILLCLDIQSRVEVSWFTFSTVTPLTAASLLVDLWHLR